MTKSALAATLAAVAFALAGCGSGLSGALGGGGLNLANLPVPIYFLNNGQPIQVDHAGIMLMGAQPATTTTTSATK